MRQCTQTIGMGSSITALGRVGMFPPPSVASVRGPGARLVVDRERLDLDGKDLSGFSIVAQDLDGSSLKHTNLSNTELACSSFRQSYMRYVILTNANAPYCRFNGADMISAVMSMSNFNESKFDESILANSDFNGSQAQGCSFNRADVSCADFSHCDLFGATFRNAKIIGTSFSNGILNDMTNSELKKAKAASVASYRSEFRRLEHAVHNGSSPAGALRRIHSMLDIDLSTNILCFPRGEIFKASPGSTRSYTKVLRDGISVVLRILGRQGPADYRLASVSEDLLRLVQSRGSILGKRFKGKSCSAIYLAVVKNSRGTSAVELQDVPSKRLYG